VGKVGLLVGFRSHAQFYWEPGFEEVYTLLSDDGIRAKILGSSKRFEQAWRNSNADNDIPRGFDFTPYPPDGPWRFIELHLGYDYRAFTMFPNGRVEAYWVHLFKKPGQKVPPKEIRLARSRAIDCWNTIQGRGNDGEI
jgi:Phage derived protein Gp49-like (DUF891)